jgi:hypothetical protein
VTEPVNVVPGVNISYSELPVEARAQLLRSILTSAVESYGGSPESVLEALVAPVVDSANYGGITSDAIDYVSAVRAEVKNIGRFIEDGKELEFGDFLKGFSVDPIYLDREHPGLEPIDPEAVYLVVANPNSPFREYLYKGVSVLSTFGEASVADLRNAYWSVFQPIEEASF